MLIARQQPRWSSNHLRKLKTFSFTGFFRRWQTDQDLCQVTTFLSLHCRCQINPFCTFVCQASIFLILLNQTLSPLTDLRSLRPKWMRQSWSPTPCGSPTRFALHLKNWVRARFLQYSQLLLRSTRTTWCPWWSSPTSSWGQPAKRSSQAFTSSSLFFLSIPPPNTSWSRCATSVIILLQVPSLPRRTSLRSTWRWWTRLTKRRTTWRPSLPRERSLRACQRPRWVSKTQTTWNFN